MKTLTRDKARDDAVVMLRNKGFTFEEIARRYKISRQRVYQIWVRASRDVQ